MYESLFESQIFQKVFIVVGIKYETSFVTGCEPCKCVHGEKNIAHAAIKHSRDVRDDTVIELL